MRFCLSLAWIGLAGLAPLGGAEVGQRLQKVVSVVRSDPHSGRLVRRIQVSPRVLRETVVQPRPVPTIQPSVSPPRVSSNVGEFVEQTAQRYQIDPLLVHSVIQVESSYNPYAVSPKGAEGLMQLMPGTARRLQVDNSFNPWQNIEGGVRYLKYLLTLFNNSERLAVAAYNAGEAAVIKHGNVPPYPETTQYVYQVARKYRAAREAARKKELNRPKPPKTEDHPPVVQFVDAEGKVYVQTRSAP